MAQVKQPADKSHFILPDLGEGVHEAELIKWRVSAGDQVAEHQTLAEMETDKALVEVPSPWAGVVTERALATPQPVPTQTKPRRRKVPPVKNEKMQVLSLEA